MKTPTPLVSIITPCYNKQKYISETIQSVLNQTYTYWELINVDDVSTDLAISVTKEFQEKDKRIILFVNAENRVANYNKNFGINAALGKYLLFLDSDDLLSQNCLSNRIKQIEKTNLDFCFFTMQIFKKNMGDLNGLWKPNSSKPLRDFLTHTLPWQTMQPIWRKKFLIEIGGFDEKFQRLQDVELHTRVLFQMEGNFKQIAATPDCHYRIDEERKNFNTVVFLQRWIDSTLAYYYKFFENAQKVNLEKKILGTIYKTFLQILDYYKNKKLGKQEYQDLELGLLNLKLYCSFTLKSKMCFKLASFFNLLPQRMPRINFIVSGLLIM